MELSPFLFGLYKLVKFTVYPYTWLCAMTAALAALAWLPSTPARTRWFRILTVAAAAIVWVIGSPVTATLFTGLLESRYPSFDRTASTHFDAVVVLGGGVSGKGSLRPTDQLSGLSLQRTLCGVDLFAEGHAPRLVLTGGTADILGESPRESVAMRQLALRLGVPEQAILIDDLARTTYENALGVKRVLGQGSILLVTSASHMPRATGLFRKQGFDVTPAPCSYRLRDWPGIWSNFDPTDIVPSLGALDAFTNSLAEVMGMITYRAAGKI